MSPGGDAAPQDPLSPMTRNATVHHEMFLAWQNSGFSEYQALTCVHAMIIGAILATSC